MPKARYRFPVTTKRLATVVCKKCGKEMVIMPNKTANQVLTEHYEKEHAE